MSEITFVNHASVKIGYRKTHILTDPWYWGSAFNYGWDLLYANPEEEIEQILKETQYIFISHEHPDHFSVPFFKKYGTWLTENGIIVLFQQTRDNRVCSFLDKIGVQILEIAPNVNTQLSEDVAVRIVRNGAIDSSLIVETPDTVFVNINDCDFTHGQVKSLEKTLPKNKRRVVFNQFSYAAWRGEDEWLKKAASYKLSKLISDQNALKGDVVIPFASFVRFSHEENQKLNTCVNRPSYVHSKLNAANLNHVFIKPSSQALSVDDLFDEKQKQVINASGLGFWEEQFENITELKCHSAPEPSSKSDDDFTHFIEMAKNNNNFALMHVIRFLSFGYVFGDCFIKITNDERLYRMNFFKVERIEGPSIQADIEISDDSFRLIFDQVFGFDTLTVNGRLKELKEGGFRKVAFALGYLNINSAGFGIRFRDIINPLIMEKILTLPIRVLKKDS